MTQENCDDANIGNHIGFSPARKFQLNDSNKRKNSGDDDLDEDEVIRQAELELAISQPSKEQRHPNTERASLKEINNDSES